jgi:HAD superfamily hydrolase (TIGR01459 family)
LQEFRGGYDALLCDVWGVLHNGVAAFAAADAALRRFRDDGGRVVLLTNAPRPWPSIREQLRGLGIGDAAYDAIVSSGDVTRALIAARPAARVLHIGPDRDLPFYEGLDIARVGEEEADLVSCTGLYDDTTETPQDYRPLLRRLAERGLELICANPDIVVERGGVLVYCAGAIADLYKELGGRAVLAGKPHRPIYDAARAKLAELGARRTLAIGDGLPTDIRGACENGLDALFVTGGIHAADFGPLSEPDGERVAARLQQEGVSAVAYMPALTWAE